MRRRGEERVAAGACGDNSCVPSKLDPIVVCSCLLTLRGFEAQLGSGDVPPCEPRRNAIDGHSLAVHIIGLVPVRLARNYVIRHTLSDS